MIVQETADSIMETFGRIRSRRGVQLNAHNRQPTLQPGRRGVRPNARGVAPDLPLKQRHLRRSIRLQNYEYSQAGAYFVTICTFQRRATLGHIQNGRVIPTPVGETVVRCWEEIPDHFPNVELDKYVLMPNHLHGIVVIAYAVGAQHAAPLRRTR